MEDLDAFAAKLKGVDGVGSVGERVIAYLDHIGRIEGKIARLIDNGFAFGMIVQHEQQHDETMLATHQLRTGAPVLRAPEPPVAVVSKNAKHHGTTDVANEYLKYLYSDQGQEIAAKNFYRPRNEAIAKKYATNFNQLKLVTLDSEFGSWAKAQKTHFADGGVFDQIYTKK